MKVKEYAEIAMHEIETNETVADKMLQEMIAIGTSRHISRDSAAEALFREFDDKWRKVCIKVREGGKKVNLLDSEFFKDFVSSMRPKILEPYFKKMAKDAEEEKRARKRKDSVLTDEQVHNWRVALSISLGPLAFIIPRSKIQQLREEMQDWADEQFVAEASKRIAAKKEKEGERSGNDNP